MTIEPVRTRPTLEEGRVLILDTDALAVRVEADRGGLFIILDDGGAWVELPLTCPEELGAIRRIAGALVEALAAALTIG